MMLTISYYLSFYLAYSFTAENRAVVDHSPDHMHPKKRATMMPGDQGKGRSKHRDAQEGLTQQAGLCRRSRENSRDGTRIGRGRGHSTFGHGYERGDEQHHLSCTLPGLLWMLNERRLETRGRKRRQAQVPLPPEPPSSPGSAPES